MSLGQRLALLAVRLQEPQRVASFQRLCGVEAPLGSPAEGEDGESEARGAAGNPRRRGQQPGAECSPGPAKPDCRGAPNGVRNGLPAEPGPAGPRRAGSLRRNSLTGEEGELTRVSNWPLYYLFCFGTELGNELFYIFFFPFWIWNLDPFVGRRLVIIWVLVMYLGQCTKDIIRWPRPASPPVVKLEIFYNSEYSMPSTHAMSGTAIPIAMVLLTYGRWQYPLLYGLILIPCWSSLVCLSRVYMGMHSILDVIAGFLYTILILVIFYPLVDLIDNFNQTYKYAPLIIIGLHLALGIFSFTLDTWSTSRGDTAEILGSGAGIACGSHAAYNLGLLLDPSPHTFPLASPPFTATLFGKAILRVAIGMIFVLIVRDIMKKITIPLACKLFSIPCDDIRQARQHMEVELPYRYITYGMVGFSITCLVPYVFSFIGIS
ncbi:sphingosine-1-phosphate phosphatase 1 [Peromyscus californicus insignis]|uniref:sphingosine-1-phosphate phosphatase 1 n=1 Tax=Peromyscus californicus insignis TaxID=564181 RepID=UPI0022A7AA84|nr:sphingosine-1-phosphate phosphatase 1 [Peromyscus californicus insignis]